MLMICDEDGEVPSGVDALLLQDPYTWPRGFHGVEKRWGPLLGAEKP
jgi:hypothetical protein